MTEHRDDATGLSRRDALRVGVGGLVAGVAGGLAGCSGLPDPGPFGDVAAPARGPAGYRNWVPGAASGGRPLRFVSRVDVSAHDRPWLSAGTAARFVSQARGGRDYLGLAREAVDAVTWLDLDAAVVRGRFSSASVARTLERGGYERAGDHAGFAVFDRPDGSRSAAVGSETVVWTGESTPATDATRVVDAGLGRGSRLAATDVDFRRLTGKLGTGTVTWVATDAGRSRGEDPFPGRVASGVATTYAAGGTYSTRLLLYEDEPPSVAAVRDQIREAYDGQLLDSYRRVEVHRGDRTVRVDGLLAEDTSASDDARPRPPVVPRITFGFDRDTDAGTVAVTHGAGDPRWPGGSPSPPANLRRDSSPTGTSPSPPATA